VIGDSTFVHSGLTGLVEMAYNPPRTGHVVIILDNSTTAMTGLQDHPGTGYTLGGTPTHKMSFEAVATALGISTVHTLGHGTTAADLETLLDSALASNDLTLIIVREPCLLASPSIREREKAREKTSKP
jgi:indolepyruvate ferredoxin oxidoreductase alpha subunit